MSAVSAPGSVSSSPCTFAVVSRHVGRFSAPSRLVHSASLAGRQRPAPAAVRRRGLSAVFQCGDLRAWSPAPVAVHSGLHIGGVQSRRSARSAGPDLGGRPAPPRLRCFSCGDVGGIQWPRPARSSTPAPARSSARPRRRFERRRILIRLHVAAARSQRGDIGGVERSDVGCFNASLCGLVFSNIPLRGPSVRPLRRWFNAATCRLERLAPGRSSRLARRRCRARPPARSPGLDLRGRQLCHVGGWFSRGDCAVFSASLRGRQRGHSGGVRARTRRCSRPDAARFRLDCTWRVVSAANRRCSSRDLSGQPRLHRAVVQREGPARSQRGHVRVFTLRPSSVSAPGPARRE